MSEPTYRRLSDLDLWERNPNERGVTPAAFAAMVYTALEDFYGWQAEREEWDDLPAEVVTAVRKAAVAADNKWGPAVAIPLTPDRWVIMGWAPS